MIVSHRFKFIFVKTHKTAGSSFEVGLGPLCGEEDIVTPMELKDPEVYSKNYYETNFWGRQYAQSSLVRKVLSRSSPLIGNWYWEHMPARRIKECLGPSIWESYHKVCIERNPWDKVVSYYFWKKAGQGKAMPSFRDYVLKKTHRLPKDGDLYFGDRGELLVDEVIQFDRLEEGVRGLIDRLKLPLSWPLPREKEFVVPDRKPYQAYYDEETRKKVAFLYAREIEQFGYTFGQDISMEREASATVIDVPILGEPSSI